MKNFKLLATFLTVALSTLITSCNKDENELDSSKSEKRISKMTLRVVQNGYASGFGTYTFYYANGKLVKIKGEGADSDTVEMSITYSGKQITYSANDPEGGSYEGVFQLNSEGFVESGIYTEATDGYREQSTCEYSNGYLTKVTLKKHSDTSGDYVEIGDIYYDANNNISMTRTTRGGTTTSYTFTASNYQSKGKTLPFAFVGIGFPDMGGMFALYYCGLLGKEPKNLVSNTTDWYAKNFNYTFDKDGYVNTMILKNDYTEETFTFSYE